MPPKPELSADQRKQMVSQRLLQVKEDTDPIVLRRGAILSVANNFDVSRSRTISKI